MSQNSVCFINLKGGVGKSTLSVAFAEYLAFVKEQKVLLIDGDPQCNSTAMMVGPEEAQRLDRNHRTLFDLIRTILDGRGAFFVDNFVKKFVSNIQGDVSGSVSLVPSTIRFADWENLLLRALAGDELTTRALHARISRAIDRLEQQTTEEYDWVVVDCPPSFGNQARLVMRLARHAVIPTTSDPLACHGTNFVIESLRRYNLRTVPTGVVISKYRQQSETARRFKEAMIKKENPPVEEKWPAVLSTVIPEAAALQRISDFAAFHPAPQSFRQKYGDKANVVANLAEELLKLVRSYQVATG